MPSPSENRAVDLFMAGFPGTELLTPDSTKPLPRREPEAKLSLMETIEGEARKPPPRGLRRRGKKAPTNMDGMFDA